MQEIDEIFFDENILFEKELYLVFYFIFVWNSWVNNFFCSAVISTQLFKIKVSVSNQ